MGCSAPHSDSAFSRLATDGARTALDDMVPSPARRMDGPTCQAISWSSPRDGSGLGLRPRRAFADVFPPHSHSPSGRLLLTQAVRSQGKSVVCFGRAVLPVGEVLE